MAASSDELEPSSGDKAEGRGWKRGETVAGKEALPRDCLGENIAEAAVWKERGEAAGLVDCVSFLLGLI